MVSWNDHACLNLLQGLHQADCHVPEMFIMELAAIQWHEMYNNVWNNRQPPFWNNITCNLLTTSHDHELGAIASLWEESGIRCGLSQTSVFDKHDRFWGV